MEVDGEVPAFGNSEHGDEPASGQEIGDRSESVNLVDEGLQPEQEQELHQQFAEPELQVAHDAESDADMEAETRLRVRIPNKRLYVGHTNVVDIDVEGFATDTRFQMELMTPRDEDAPVIIRRKADGNYQMAFMPEMAGLHVLSIYRENREKPELRHELEVEVVSHKSLGVKVEMTPSVQAMEAAYCSVSIDDVFKADELFRVMISDPEGEFISYVSDVVENGILIEFVPVKIGRYRAQAYYNSRLVENSIAHCMCYDMRKVKIVDFDTEGIVNTDLTFTIDCSEAGEPYDVRVAVKSASGQQLAVNGGVKDAGIDGVLLFRFVPLTTENHEVDIRFNNFRLPGSPFAVKVHPPLPMVRELRDPTSAMQARVGELVWVHFDPRSVSSRESEIESAAKEGESTVVHRGFEMKVLAPDGSAAQYACSRKRNRVVVLEFQPKMTGRHTVNVLHTSDQSHVPGSPFYIDVEGGTPAPSLPVGTTTVMEARKVKLSLTGTGLRDANANEDASFLIELSGDADAINEQPIVKVTKKGVEAPRVADVKTKVERLEVAGQFRCTYRPTSAGVHLLHISLGTTPIQGSPLEVAVQEVQETVDCVVHETFSVPIGFAEAVTDLSLIGVNVLSPTKDSADCELLADPADNRSVTLNLVPHEPGKHVVEVRLNGLLLPELGLTLHAKYDKPVHAIRVHGDGIQSGSVTSEQSRRTFFCDTRGAGKGQLTCRIKSPRGYIRAILTRLKRKGDDEESKANRRIECNYDALSDGEYTIELYWRTEDGVLESVPGSPFTLNVSVLDAGSQPADDQEENFAELNAEPAGSDYEVEEQI